MMALPTERTATLAWYDRIEIAALAEGGNRWWHAERWLAQNDLFYLLTRVLRRIDVNRDWLFDRCREVQAEPNGCLDLWSRGHYKDLATTTPVLTLNRGWATHGDLAPGDLVFAPDGTEVAVQAVTQHFTDSRCYLVTFNDGTQIVAGAGHEWRLRRKVKRRVPGTWRRGHFRQVDYIPEVATTAELANRRGRRDVGTCAPLQFSELPLPIDPYVLGVWLGDGASDGTRVTAGHADAPWMAEALAACGTAVTVTTHPNAISLRLGSGRRGDRSSSDIANALRALGVMGNKHLPLAYMRGSVSQRLALLQGLMDTDGACDDRGTATFVQARLGLSEQVFDLAASLGMRPRLRRYVGTYGGGNVFWQVSFQAHTDRNPFRMPRKAAKAIPPSHYRGVRTMVRVEPMPSVPTNCIQVEGGLYCVGKTLVPTHNSTIITFGLTMLDIINNPELTIAVLSHTRPIAKGFLVQLKREMEENPILKALFPDIFWEVPHRDSPRWGEDAGIVVRRKSNPKESTVEGWGLIDGQPTSRHFDILIYDDVVTRENVTTGEQVRKTTEALELSMNLAAKDGKMRFIGTRYSLFDTYADLLDRNAAKPRIYPATHNGKFDGRPVLFSADEWRGKLRDMSRTTIAAQLLQNPMADSSATFRTEWLKSYEVRPRTLNVYVLADPSRGRSATSDNTAIAVIGIAAGGAKFLLDGACHRMTLSQRWTMLRNLRRKWSAARGVQHIEVGYERYGAQSDDEYFTEQMDLDAKRGIRDSHFTIAELNWPREGGNSKKERVERLEPDFRNGRFYLPLPVWRNGAPQMWRVDTDVDSKSFGEIGYRELGLTRAQMAAVEGGSADLVAKAIRCVDQDGRMYDLTLRFMDEYGTFPFGRNDDLVDACSRVYDMEPRGPAVTRPEMLEPVEHWDR